MNEYKQYEQVISFFFIYNGRLNDSNMNNNTTIQKKKGVFQRNKHTFNSQN